MHKRRPRPPHVSQYGTPIRSSITPELEHVEPPTHTRAIPFKIAAYTICSVCGGSKANWVAMYGESDTDFLCEECKEERTIIIEV